ncbi:hypothetical protein [Roseiterribacter gracilis]|uniref:Uncharacterized protein n=1 Tax=Roseiterribacter gracilis TaxID=2812848 RepID=A0A8S8X6Z7_9PROT|nr:hypothetical protein TMPK1_14250 [Rhodospirillales bacterium TMPK1]
MRFAALLALLLCLSAQDAFAGRGELPGPKSDITVFRVPTGLFVISNDPLRWYTMRLEGHEVDPGKSSSTYVVDGKPLQVLVPPAPKDPAGFDDATRRLIVFRDQLAANISKQLKFQIYPNSTPLTFSDGRQGMWINIELPNGAAPPRSRWYLAKITDQDWLMLLGSGTTVGETPDSVRNFMLRVMESTKVYAQPIDIEALKKALLPKK